MNVHSWYRWFLNKDFFKTLRDFGRLPLEMSVDKLMQDMKERDEFKKERDKFKNKIDSYKQKRDQLKQERRHFKQERDEFKQKMDDLARERDDLKNELGEENYMKLIQKQRDERERLAD